MRRIAARGRRAGLHRVHATERELIVAMQQAEMVRMVVEFGHDQPAIRQQAADDCGALVAGQRRAVQHEDARCIAAAVTTSRFPTMRPVTAGSLFNACNG